MVHDSMASEEETTRDSKRASSQMQEDLQQQQQADAVKCPRCDSMNTKFCYYNNYSLTQPRHFCKTCRRYWTKGGALRNVPIGGGSRKSKKFKPSSSNSSKDYSTSSDLGGLKLFHGLPSSPIMDFQLGGLTLPMLNLNSPPSLSEIVYNQFSSSFGDIGSSSITTPNYFSLDQSLGLNFTFTPLIKQHGENHISLGGVGAQDLGYVGSNVSSLASHAPYVEHHQQIQRPQPLLLQNLDISARENGIYYGNNSSKEGLISGNIASSYFFEEICSPTINPTTSTIASNGANNGNQNGSTWNNGVQGWGNMDQFNALP
ncbi:hypothetical protein Leryth_006421 [Lithospermum erythrorhizon]|uniref:Dof zinc finger protein n=1 Tax=Lithospermum erythrorhizon TaxID=34254 RepID=A0AAV3QD62_LITER|nr:hypothetical protein Leryth_006421 [Lithospermum erythrorhizon]